MHPGLAPVGSRQPGQAPGQLTGHAIAGNNRLMAAGAPRHVDFGDRVRRRRRALEWTQAQLAERVACSEDMVRKIESGARRPSRWLAERLARQLQLDVPGAALASVARGPAAAAAAPTAVAPPFVGREAEMAELRLKIKTVQGGSGALVLIEGEPGIGKSHLARAASFEFERTAVPGQCAVVACYEIDAASPLQPLLDWMHRLLDIQGPELLEALSPATVAELVELSPQVRELRPDVPLLSPAPELRRARIFSAFSELVAARLRAGPLMVVIDDIHWADELTLALIHRLVRQLTRRPLLVVCTFRSEELDGNPSLTLFVRSAQADLGAARLALERLRQDDVHRLLAGQPELAERLFGSSHGHPLYLVSMLQQLRDHGTAQGLPIALRDSIRERLQRLSGPARAVVEFAAVLGRRFEVHLLERACGMTGDGLAQAVDLLVQRRLLRAVDDDGGLDFDHDVIRQVISDDLGAARRVVLHRRAAEALGDAEGDNGAWIARHHEGSGDWGPAIALYAAAARRSLGMSALVEAAGAIERAVELAALHRSVVDATQWQQLHETKGDIHAQDGAFGVAVTSFETALSHARAVGDAQRACELLAKLGMAHRRADDYASARVASSEALAAARGLQEPSRIADALYHLGTVAWSDGENEMALRCHSEAVALCEEHGLGGLVAVQAYHGHGESQMADCLPRLAIERFEKSLALARGIGDRGYEAENVMMIGYCHSGAFGLGDYAQALRCAEEGLAIAEAADQVWHEGPLHLLKADALRCMGHVGQAQALLEAEVERSQALTHARFGIMALDMLGRLFCEVGRHAEAEDCWQSALAASHQHDVHFWRAQLMAGLAQARLQQGLQVDWVGLNAASEAARARRDRYVHARCLEVQAEGALANGKSEEAGAFARQMLALAEPAGMRELAAIARFAFGRAMAPSSPARARRHIDAALSEAETIGRPWLVARVLSARGSGSQA